MGSRAPFERVQRVLPHNSCVELALLANMEREYPTPSLGRLVRLMALGLCSPCLQGTARTTTAFCPSRRTQGNRGEKLERRRRLFELSFLLPILYTLRQDWAQPCPQHAPLLNVFKSTTGTQCWTCTLTHLYSWTHPVIFALIWECNILWQGFSKVPSVGLSLLPLKSGGIWLQWEQK